MVDYLSILFSTTDTLFMIIWIVLGLFVIGALFFWIIMLLKYKHRIIIRVVASDRKFIVFEKFRSIKDEEGVIWWKLLKRKHKIPVAPAQAIEISKKGAMVVEAYYTDEGEYVYITDEIKPKHFDNIHGAVYVTKKVTKRKYDDEFREYKERLVIYNSLNFLAKLATKKPKKPYEPDEVGRYVYIEDKNKSIKGFDPFTTKQRLILVNQYKKAQARKKMKWTEHIPAIVSMVALLVILIVVFMFWEDITRPSLEAMKTMGSIAETQKDITEMLQEMIQKKQIIDDEGGTRGQLSEPPT